VLHSPVCFPNMASTDNSKRRRVAVAIPDASQVQVQLAIRYGRGSGLRNNVLHEVVHVSLQFVSDSDKDAIIMSEDPLHPYCFHHSRLRALELAQTKRAEIESLGFGGPAISLRIPGIPFAQEQDTGLHISLYNQPRQEGASYTPPNKELCAALDGERFSIRVDGALKIMNGSESNDLKVGGCYYVSQACGSDATKMINDIKARVGLDRDETQQFHLSLATIAPSWLPCHPKSKVGSQHQKLNLLCQQAFQVFRHGDSKAGFVGFNDDFTTGWSKYSSRTTEAGRSNAEFSKMIKELPVSQDHESEKLRLQQQIINIPKTFGFCKTVGSQESIQTITQPDSDAQLAAIQNFWSLWLVDNTSMDADKTCVATINSGSQDKRDLPDDLNRKIERSRKLPPGCGSRKKLRKEIRREKRQHCQVP